MKVIDIKLLKKFVQMAAERLSGDWIIIGGTVLPLLKIDYRVTVDIDVVAGHQRSNEQDALLMELAEELGLPVEAINQAGHYFLHKIKDWQNQMVLLAKGKNAKIYRPNATLFILLKLDRMSESDLTDCQAMIEFSKTHKDELDPKRLQQRINKKISEIERDHSKRERYQTLLKHIDINHVAL